MSQTAIRFNDLADLNPEQRAVVEASGGPMLVIAGAGSGKTRTVTARVARLIQTGIPPDRVLLVTFTNKAAREMLHRVDLLVGGKARAVWGGTFHHIGNLILRRHAALIGYQSSFTILDREDSKDLIETCIAEAGIDKKARRFPKGEVLASLFSLAANTGRPLEDLIEERLLAFVDLTDTILGVAERYAKKKPAVNAMDFDDLLVNWKRLFTDHQDVLRRYADRFLHILVDEYQDTNRLQAEIVDLLASDRHGGHRNLVACGDDGQSIFGFRGAHFANIIEFPKRYPDATLYRLETNYRSTPEVLALANSCLRHNERQFPKALKAVRRPGEKPSLVPARDVLHQAAFVADRMLELRDAGRSLNEMAVLYRAHYHSMELQMELTRRGIPFAIRSGLRFFEQAHIKDVTAHLKIAVNPRDELAWKRVLRLLPKIGTITAERVWQVIAGSADPWAALESEAMAVLLPRGAAEGWKECAALLKTLREPALLENPSRMIEQVIAGGPPGQGPGYAEYLQAAYLNAAERLEDLKQLALFARSSRSAEVFLSELALLGTVEPEVATTEETDERVVLSTVHQAKGLEWPVVFVVWLTDGRFPSQRALETLEGEKSGEEEERRLFYVAATRAKDDLYLCYPLLNEGGRGGSWICRASRFVQELEPETYTQVVLEPGLADLAASSWDFEV